MCNSAFTLPPASMPPEAPPDESPLRVVVFSDLHIPLGMPAKETILANREFLDGHHWAVLLGDVTACYGTPAEYREVDAFITALGRPYDVVNGNHEFSFDPQEDGSETYSRVWRHADPATQKRQLRRFESFYTIPSRYRVHAHPSATLALMGVDGINEFSGAELDHNHAEWLERTIRMRPDKPLVVFCHFPLADLRLDRVRYYAPGRKPYYAPPPQVRDALRARLAPVVWFSGHVHFAPTHPLAKPYQTAEGVWQIHCPDGWGFGRPDDDQWAPTSHDDVFVQRMTISSDAIQVATADLRRHQEEPLLEIRCGTLDDDRALPEDARGRR